MLRDVPREARLLVLTGPLFAATALVGPFAVAYQDAFGLTAEQIGLLASAATGLGLLCLFLGSWASARWGRLRAMVLFDVLGFVVPFALLAAARSPAEVAVAVVLGGAAQGAQAGFQGLLMAEVAEGQRQRVLALEHLLLALPSIALPLAASALVAAWGLVPATRALYVVAAASVALMVGARWWLLRGRARVHPAQPAAPSWRGLHRALGEAGLAPVLVASGLLAFAGGLGVLAQLRVVHVLGLEDWWLGPFAFAMTAADVAASALATRWRAPSRWFAVAGALLAAAGAALFVFAGAPVLLLLSGAVLGVAGSWAGLGTGALLHDAVPPALRDHAVAAMLALRGVGSLVGPAVGGVLYGLDPALPWWTGAGLFAATAGLLALPKRRAAAA